MAPPPTSRLTELLTAAARGERAAFAALYAETSPQLFAVALRILRRRDWAEDVLQEAYVSVWRRARDYDATKGSVFTWMTSIVRNRAIDMLRRDRGTTPLDEAPGRETWADPGPDPLSATLASAEARRVRGCLDTLEGKQREAIVVAYFEGLTQEELAQRLSAPLGTVKSWVRRGLLRLKECLGP